MLSLTNDFAKLQNYAQKATFYIGNNSEMIKMCPFLKKVDSVCWFNLGWLTLCLRVVV